MKCPTAQRGLSVGGAVLVDEIVKGASVRQQDSEWAKIPKKEKKRGLYHQPTAGRREIKREKRNEKRRERWGKKGEHGRRKKKKSQKHRWYVWSDTLSV